MSTDSAGLPKRSVLDPSRVTAYIVCQETSIQMHADDILIYAHVWDMHKFLPSTQFMAA